MLLAFAKECGTLHDLEEGMFRIGALRDPYKLNLTYLSVNLSGLFELKNKKLSERNKVFFEETLFAELVEMGFL